LSRRLERWRRRTEPDLVDRAYRASRDVQLELGGQAQLKHEQLISLVKRMIEHRVSNPILKHAYVSYAQKVASIREKYGPQLASRQAAGEIMRWVLRGLDQDLMVEIAEAMGLDPRPHLALPAPPPALPPPAPAQVELSFCGVIVCGTTVIPQGVSLTVGKYGLRVEEGGTLINDGTITVVGG